MRKDLKPGAQLAQSCHVAMHFMQEFPSETEEWMSISDYICILNIDNESALLNLIEIAKDCGIKFSIFREPDIGNEITAIALQPGCESKRLCRNLPLALKEDRK